MTMEKKQSLYERIKEVLAVASRVIITAPLKLPARIVAVARYVALAIGLLDAVENGREQPDKTEGHENG